MKNNIAQFYRPITFIFSLGSLDCWIREICDEYSLLSLTWDGQKLVCCKIAPMWAKDYAQTLISEVLRQVPMSLPDEEPLDIEYADDPPTKRWHHWVASGVLPWMLPNGVTLSMAYPIPHIQDNNDCMTQLEKDALELAAKYPHMDVEQWKAFLLSNCDSEKNSTR